MKTWMLLLLFAISFSTRADSIVPICWWYRQGPNQISVYHCGLQAGHTYEVRQATNFPFCIPQERFVWQDDGFNAILITLHTDDGETFRMHTLYDIKPLPDPYFAPPPKGKSQPIGTAYAQATTTRTKSVQMPPMPNGMTATGTTSGPPQPPPPVPQLLSPRDGKSLHQRMAVAAPLPKPKATLAAGVVGQWSSPPGKVWDVPMRPPTNHLFYPSPALNKWNGGKAGPAVVK